MRFIWLALMVMGCSDILKVRIDTSEVPYDEITLSTTTDIAVTEDTGCDSGELCDTAG